MRCLSFTSVTEEAALPCRSCEEIRHEAWITVMEQDEFGSRYRILRAFTLLSPLLIIVAGATQPLTIRTIPTAFSAYFVPIPNMILNPGPVLIQPRKRVTSAFNASISNLPCKFHRFWGL